MRISRIDTNFTKPIMKKILFIVCMVMAAVTASAVVKPGVEVLRDGGFAPLQGKRVGLYPHFCCR